MYARLADVLGTQTHRLKTLLPNVSNPENIPVADLEAIHGIVEVERVYAPLEWYQTRGEPVVDDTVRPVTITHPAVDLPLGEAKARAKQRIDGEAESSLNNGIVSVAGHEYDTRPKTIIRITGAALKAVIDPTFTTPWITQANEEVTLDAAGIIEVGNAMAVHEATAVFTARAKKDAVEAATTLAEVIGAAG